MTGDADADDLWMRDALAQARLAERRGEVPIGAVVVRNGELVARGHNRTIGDCDPSAHAEIVALRRAGRRLRAARLPDVQVYVTLEPCAMCVGAMIQARIERLVFGCRDPKAGAVVTLHELASDARLNHRIPFREGVLGEECGELLRSFFRARR
ncbi:MAG: tRNA adenosine(34) deaminase TadA [Candidatus Binatia bacterium]